MTYLSTHWVIEERDGKWFVYECGDLVAPGYIMWGPISDEDTARALATERRDLVVEATARFKDRLGKQG